MSILLTNSTLLQRRLVHAPNLPLFPHITRRVEAFASRCVRADVSMRLHLLRYRYLRLRRFRGTMVFVTLERFVVKIHSFKCLFSLPSVAQ